MSEVLAEASTAGESNRIGEQKYFDDHVASEEGMVGHQCLPDIMAEKGETVDAPRRACVLPAWSFELAHGLSDSEQAPEVWTKRLDEWRDGGFREGKGVFSKKTRLFLVCAHTSRLVPCGHNGQGYDIARARTWFYSAASLAKFALELAVATMEAVVGMKLPAHADFACGLNASLQGASAEGGGAEDIIQVDNRLPRCA